MKKWLCLLLALALTGCAAVTAETEPAEVAGKLTLRYLAGGVLVQCNGEMLLVGCTEEIGSETLEYYEAAEASVLMLNGEELPAGLEALPVLAPEEAKWLDCARLTVLRPEKDGEKIALKLTFGQDSFLFLGDMDENEQSALAEAFGQELGSAMLHLKEGTGLSEALLTAASPAYIMVDGRAAEDLKENFAVYDTEDFGTVTVESEGAGVTLGWMVSASTPATY